MSYAYPTEEKEISSIIYECLYKDEMEIMKEYGLEPFKIKTQTIERTMINKIFAVCDYYMLGKSSRNSRHLYDIYKLKGHIKIDDDFRNLFKIVRNYRMAMDIKITPSSRLDVNLLKISEELIKVDFYAKDYDVLTTKLIKDNISYDTVKDNFIEVVRCILKYNNFID